MRLLHLRFAGHIEISLDRPDGVRILSAVTSQLALPVSESAKAKPEALREELRLKHRVLDLRRVTKL